MQYHNVRTHNCTPHRLMSDRSHVLHDTAFKVATRVGVSNPIVDVAGCCCEFIRACRALPHKSCSINVMAYIGQAEAQIQRERLMQTSMKKIAQWNTAVCSSMVCTTSFACVHLLTMWSHSQRMYLYCLSAFEQVNTLC
jgi:hypothetical protein